MRGKITKDLSVIRELAYKDTIFMDRIINVLTDIIMNI